MKKTIWMKSQTSLQTSLEYNMYALHWMQISEWIMGTTFTKMSSIQQNILGEVPFHISIEFNSVLEVNSCEKYFRKLRSSFHFWSDECEWIYCIYTVYCARYFIHNIAFSFYVFPVLHRNTFHYVNCVMLPLNQAEKSLCKEWNKCTLGVAQCNIETPVT